ncbi:hypothetical protein BpHYR1_001724 [Brachionus plicatilis]|uniref:Uncharacterized protein n=1 Tax=Brachionus plicatilis TaxID=10195 RepID=A0A3M7SYJ7_BRAPC|nr:hypothetical protein BpHYR1_001724 [Brachionus plicatilis]
MKLWVLNLRIVNFETIFIHISFQMKYVSDLDEFLQIEPLNQLKMLMNIGVLYPENYVFTFFTKDFFKFIFFMTVISYFKIHLNLGRLFTVENFLGLVEHYPAAFKIKQICLDYDMVRVGIEFACQNQLFRIIDWLLIQIFTQHLISQLIALISDQRPAKLEHQLVQTIVVAETNNFGLVEIADQRFGHKFEQIDVEVFAKSPEILDHHKRAGQIQNIFTISCVQQKTLCQAGSGRPSLLTPSAARKGTLAEQARTEPGWSWGWRPDCSPTRTRAA